MLAAGAIISIFSVTLVSVYGQTRILFAMSRDGMIPEIFHRVNPRTLTPIPNTIIVAAVISLLAGLIPINFLAEMTSIGTLVAFITVAIGVIVLRQRNPDLPRSFKVPLYPVTPILAILGSVWIITNLRLVTIYVFVVWVAIAFIWYLVYARNHSHLGRHEHVGLTAETRSAMTILVGYPINRRAKAVLRMAEMLARSSGEELVVCVVIPAPWMPGLSRADEGYRSYINESADAALAQARADLAPDVPAKFTTVDARSAPSGLMQAADQYKSTIIAVGSSDAGQFGYITLSSVADRLLHSSPVPVAVSPRGFRAQGGKVGRVTVAFTGDKESGVLLRAAETLATRFGAQLRLVSFAVQLSPPETARFRAEGAAVMAEWTATIRSAAKEALEAERNPGQQPAESEVVIGHGEDWKEAFEDVEWRAGDVLLVGSSESGPVARVFLGSRAGKVVRHSPVPVLGVPRTAARELAEE